MFINFCSHENDAFQSDTQTHWETEKERVVVNRIQVHALHNLRILLKLKFRVSFSDQKTNTSPKTGVYTMRPKKFVLIFNLKNWLSIPANWQNSSMLRNFPIFSVWYRTKNVLYLNVESAFDVESFAIFASLTEALTRICAVACKLMLQKICLPQQIHFIVCLLGVDCLFIYFQSNCKLYRLLRIRLHCRHTMSDFIKCKRCHSHIIVPLNFIRDLEFPTSAALALARWPKMIWT